MLELNAVPLNPLTLNSALLPKANIPLQQRPAWALYSRQAKIRPFSVWLNIRLKFSRMPIVSQALTKYTPNRKYIQGAANWYTEVWWLDQHSMEDNFGRGWLEFVIIKFMQRYRKTTRQTSSALCPCACCSIVSLSIHLMLQKKAIDFQTIGPVQLGKL